MAKYLKCGHLFEGTNDTLLKDQILIIDNERIVFSGGSSNAPPPQKNDEIIDYSQKFVLPGLIDIHVHLSYGNAQANEDVDMYAPPEFRALRALLASQKVLAAGYTSLADPASTNRVSTSVRDAINSGMFVGPRITSSGRQITARQGLGDWYPTWIGVPESSVGVLVRNTDEAIEEIRMQVKDRVDFVKFTADGLEEVSKSGATLSPALTFLVNTVEFTRKSDPCFKWRPNMNRNDVEIACEMLIEAHKMGIPFMVGSDSGFAVTPYGEWHARELEIMVKYLGFSPGEALKCTTSENSKLLREGNSVGRLATGSFADITVVNGNPLENITTLQDAKNIEEVYLNGNRVDFSNSGNFAPFNWEHSYRQWNEVYTRERIKELAH